MKRKIASVCMALLLVLMLMPVRAAAAGAGFVSVNGNAELYKDGQLTGATYPGAQFNPATNTLTLTNYTGTKIYAHHLPSLTIELVGDNTVQSGNLGIGLEMPTTIRGAGTLTMAAPVADRTGLMAALASSSDLTLESGHIRIATGDVPILGGLAVVGNLIIGPDATVDITTTGLPAMKELNAVAPNGGALACGGKLEVQGMRTIRQGNTPAALATGTTLATTTATGDSVDMLLIMVGVSPRPITIAAPCVTIGKGASLTALTAGKADLPPEGGAVSFTLTGKNLPVGMTLTARENGAATGPSATTTGTGDTANAAITFPANNTKTAKAYTVKITVPGHPEQDTPTATVTVAAKTTRVQQLSLNMNSKVLRRGQRVKLKATILPKAAAGEPITWKSSNTKIATVTKNGVVKAKKNGAATITARVGGKLVRCRIVVRADASKKAVRNVELNESRLTLKRRQSQKLKATLNPVRPYNRKLVWTTSNPKVAKVNKNGKVTAVGKGTCKITVRSFEGGKTDVCTIRVK